MLLDRYIKFHKFTPFHALAGHDRPYGVRRRNRTVIFRCLDVWMFFPLTRLDENLMKQTQYSLLAAACLMLAGPVGAQTLLSDTGTATVPAGVYWVDVVIGGAGGSGGNYDAEQGGPGGKGAQITATVAVQPGDVLTAIKGVSGTPTPSAQSPVVGATGGAGSGKGGDGALAASSGGGGGGGGATVVQIGGTYLRAGGGGGGGGDSWWGNYGMEVGGDAGTVLADTPACATPADGENATPTSIDGGGGGGGGGGYQGAAGTAGAGGQDGTANGGGGTGGGSCYSAGPKNAFHGTPAASAGPAGGVGGDGATGRGTAGGDGTVLVTVNKDLPPPASATVQSVPTLDLLGLGLLASLLAFFGLRKRHG